MILYPSPIFGPVHSRRLGLSLGINLMPADGKVCTFDCIYCECGFNADHAPRLPRPTREQVREALESKLRQMTDEGRLPDVLTFAGNGEPTLHPDFPHIILDTRRLRDRCCPQARISVLSNATRAMRPDVAEALRGVDNNILKLDTVSSEYIARVDRPTGHYRVEETVQALCAFQGQCIVQTLFMCGTDDQGRSVDNTSPAYVEPWLEALRRIRPRQVMIYTIDRETPEHGLRKASPRQLHAIARQVEALGLETNVAL